MYLCKKASEGPFELNSDNESLKLHYESIVKFFKPFMYLELIAALLQVPGMCMGSFLNIFSFILLIILFLGFFTTIKSFEKRIDSIDKDM